MVVVYRNRALDTEEYAIPFFSSSLMLFELLEAVFLECNNKYVNLYMLHEQ